MSDARYPKVDALEKAIADLGLRLAVEPHGSGPRLGAYRRVRIEWSGSMPAGGLVVPVHDEYDDASDANPPLLLHLVLAECEAYEVAGDFAEWAVEAEVDRADAGARELYDRLGRVIPAIRELVGTGVDAIPVWDFTMGAGAARELRRRGK